MKRLGKILKRKMAHVMVRPDVNLDFLSVQAVFHDFYGIDISQEDAIDIASIAVDMLNDLESKSDGWESMYESQTAIKPK